MTVIVNVAGVSKTYGGIHHILENCSVEIQKGKRIGMVGPNGAAVRKGLIAMPTDEAQQVRGAIKAGKVL